MKNWNKCSLFLRLFLVLLIPLPVFSGSKTKAGKHTEAENLAARAVFDAASNRWTVQNLALEARSVYTLSGDSAAEAVNGLVYSAAVLFDGSPDPLYFSLLSGYRRVSFRFSPERNVSSMQVTLPAGAVMKNIVLTKTGTIPAARNGADSGIWLENPLAPVPTDSRLQNCGAELPFITTQAEDMTYRGMLTGPSRSYTDMISEASGRKGVNLSSDTDFVEFRSPADCNSLVVRFALPDSGGGKGTKLNLALTVDDVFVRDITLSSAYVVVYGNFPWSNDPSRGKPRHWFDEEAILLDKTIPAGATIRLERKEKQKAKFCIIDLVDTELVAPPVEKPAGYFSVVDYGAVPDTGKSCTDAIEACIKAAKKAKAPGIYIPKGSWTLSEDLYGDITYQGAGMWYTKLISSDVCFRGINRHFEVHDVAIYGNALYRDDTKSNSGLEGNCGKDSVFENVWITHTKAGIWTDRGTDGLVIKNCRIRNTMADGINLYRGTVNSTVTNCHFRGTGDDSIALWSAKVADNTVPNSGNRISGNTIQCPWLANCIAVYGGGDVTIENNLAEDTVLNGAAIDISSNFDPIPFCGKVTVTNNIGVRCGSYSGDGGHRTADYEKDYHGALWIDLVGTDLPSLEIDGLELYDSTIYGITIEGPGKIMNGMLKNTVVNGASSFAIRVLDTAAGTLNISAVSSLNCLSGELYNMSSLDIRN